MSPLITHRLQGERGEVVLLLNGGMMTYPSWAPITEELLAAGYRVLGCDFRGQLLTPGPAPTRLEPHAEDVLAVLDHLDDGGTTLGPVHLLGTSFGGFIAQILASEEPRRFRSLAIVTSAERTPEGMPESSRQMQELVREVIAGGSSQRFRDALIDDFYSPAYRRNHADELKTRQRQTAALPLSWYEGLLGLLQSLEDFDLSPRLDAIDCPALVVHAALDAVMPAERAQALLQGLGPSAELRVHPSSGHALVVEDPTWLAATYLDFLANLQKEATP